MPIDADTVHTDAMLAGLGTPGHTRPVGGRVGVVRPGIYLLFISGHGDEGGTFNVCTPPVVAGQVSLDFINIRRWVADVCIAAETSIIAGVDAVKSGGWFAGVRTRKDTPADKSGVGVDASERVGWVDLAGGLCGHGAAWQVMLVAIVWSQALHSIIGSLYRQPHFAKGPLLADSYGGIAANYLLPYFLR